MDPCRKNLRFALAFAEVAMRLLPASFAGVAIATFSFAGVTLAGGSLSDVLIVGYNHVPPDTMQIDGQAHGPANELLKRVAVRMGVELKFKHLPLARLISQANANNIDLINRIGANPALIVKPTVPFTATSPGILVAKRTGVNSWEDLIGKKSFRIGTKIGMPLTDTMKSQVNKIIYQPGTRALQNSVLMTHRGRLDGVYSPALGELVVMASEYKILDAFTPVKLPDKPWKVYVAFSPKAHQKYYQSYVKALIEEQKAHPYHITYTNFLQDFFPRMPQDILNSLRRDAVK